MGKHKLRQIDVDSLNHKLQSFKDQKEEANEAWRQAVEEGDARETDAITVTVKMLEDIDREIMQIVEVLENYELISNSSSTEVEVGDEVSVLINQEIRRYILVDPFVSDITKSMISFQSPIGKLLLGKRPGFKGTVQIGPETKEIEILSKRPTQEYQH